ncbi:MAG TPA: ChbG/HpnK family deacetylase [Planctomycetaceae bacterium]|nr:ChbG/HpnK family deacetylase [Planctomycetaceae bacterium]
MNTRQNVSPGVGDAAPTEEQSAGNPSGRCLVLHADDFGMNAAVNRGVLAGFTQGLLTSTAILSNAPAFPEAISAWSDLLAAQRSGGLPSAASRALLEETAQPFELGVHLNLSQGRPLTGAAFPRQFLNTHGQFLGIFQLLPRLVALGSSHRIAIRDELCAQIERVIEQGVAPSHLNGHQYVEMLPVVAGIIPELLDAYGIGAVRVAWERHLSRTTLLHRFQPTQWCLAQVKRMFAFDFLVRMRRCGASFPDGYFGTAHAGRIDRDLLDCFLSSCGPGLTEIGVHPGAHGETAEAADGWHDPLATLRPLELDWLTSSALVDSLVRKQFRLGRISGRQPIRAALEAA